ncbi:SIMPL domain-containing protein [bacterium]|nr:SIMPL domain-containing protein [bacterium]
MRLAKRALLPCLLLVLAVSGRAQDYSQSAEQPQPEDSDDRIVLNARGHAEAPATGVVMEFIVRGHADSADEAQRVYEKKMRKLLKGMEETAPVTTLIDVALTADRKAQINGVVFKQTPNGNTSFTLETGATFSGRFLVEVRRILEVPPGVARRRLAQVMDKLAENELTGAEEDVDIMFTRLETDLDALREKCYADAVAKARKRAEILAPLTGRKLGKMSIVREVGSTSNAEKTQYTQVYFNFVYPGALGGWKSALSVKLDVDLVIAFELQ